MSSSWPRWMWRWRPGRWLLGGNLAVASFAHLVQVIRHGLKKIQYQPGLIEGCLAGTGLTLARTRRNTNGHHELKIFKQPGAVSNPVDALRELHVSAGIMFTFGLTFCAWLRAVGRVHVQDGLVAGGSAGAAGGRRS